MRSNSQGLAKRKIERNLQKRSFEYLKKSNGLLIIINPKGKIEFVNDFIEEVLHFKTSEVIDKNIAEFLQQDSYKKIEDALHKFKTNLVHFIPITDILMYCMECRKRYFDGFLAAFDLQDGKGNYYHTIYLQETTKHKEIEIQLRDVNEELEAFVYRASHDLRAPLLSVKGLINLAKDEVEKSSVYLNLMEKSINKLDEFIIKLTEYAQNKHNKSICEPINLRNLIVEVIETHRYQKNADRINFVVDITKEKLIYADEFRLKIILNNLISNAIKYHRFEDELPYIRISVHYILDDIIEIEVKDNGQGIKQQYLDTLFEMFSRANSSREGTGLGLFIVKKALEKMGGSTQVNSVFGKGSIFKIHLKDKQDECMKLKNQLVAWDSF